MSFSLDPARRLCLFQSFSGWRKSRRRGATIDALLLIPIYFLVEWILCLYVHNPNRAFSLAFCSVLSSFFSLFCEIQAKSFHEGGGPDTF